MAVPQFSKERSFRKKEDLKTGERVDVIILGYDYPADYLIALAEANKKSEEKANELGIDFSPKKPSFKESGISWHLAVLRRAGMDAEPKEMVFKSGETSMIAPDYPAVCWFDVLAPSVHKTKKVGKNGFLIGDMMREGGGDFIGRNKNKPAIIDLFPEANYSSDPNKEVPRAKKRRFHELSDAEIERYTEWNKIERKRLSDWDKLLDWWNKLSEEEAFENLLEYSARRLFLFDKQAMENSEIKYLTPVKGMIFRGAIERYKEESPFINIVAFSRWQQEQETGAWTRTIYSTGGTLNDYGETIAESVLNCLTVKTLDQQEDTEDEESPFVDDKPKF
jgi:hypothetical protein